MTKTAISIASIAVVAGFTAAGSVDAKYLCDDPPTRIDERACEAASEGPDALRHFVDRMRVIESLDFSAYVNEQTVLAWQAKEAEAEQERLAAK